MASQGTIRRLKERVGELESELALLGPGGPGGAGVDGFGSEATARELAKRLVEKDEEIARLKGLLARQGAKLWTETVPMTADMPRPGAPWTAPLVDAPSGKRAPHGRVAKTALEVKRKLAERGAETPGVCGQFCTAIHEHVRGE